jgi:aconitate hydratase
VTLTPPPPLAIKDARVLLMLGDNVTTDHISPAGAIPKGSLAGEYLSARGVPAAEFNQYSTRRSNHEVMLRGAFGNPRLRNELLGEEIVPGNLALTEDGCRALPAYEAAESYRRKGVPVVILAGRNYGAGSSRDWGAKAPMLLGVRAILADSFERIHRSNLIGMGILPITFPEGASRRDIARDGRETLSFSGLDRLAVGANRITVVVSHSEHAPRVFELVCQIDSQRELETLRHGGFLPLVVRNALAQSPHPVPPLQPEKTQ